MTTTSVTVPECPICGERYGGPVVPHILTCCKNDVCFDCAERDRSVQVSELTGNRKRIKCMYCRELYHSTNETPWIMNRPLIKVLGIHVVDFRVTAPQCSSSSLRNESRTTTTTITRTRTETNGHEANDPALVLEEEVPTTVEVPTEQYHDGEEQPSENVPGDVLPPLTVVADAGTLAADVPPTRNILFTDVLNSQVSHTHAYPVVNRTDPVADPAAAPLSPPLLSPRPQQDLIVANGVPDPAPILVNQIVQNNPALLDLENMVLSLDALKDRDFSVHLLYTFSHCAADAFVHLPTGYHCTNYAKRNLTSDYCAFFNFVATISFYHNHDADSNTLNVLEYAKQHDMYVKGVKQEFEAYKQALHASATYNKTWYGPIKPASLHIYLTPRQTQQRLLFAYSIPWRVNEFSNRREHNQSHKYKCFTGWLPVFQQLKYAFWK